MHNKCQRVLSTKALPHPVTERLPEEKKRYVFITVYDPKGKMYTDQTWKFPHWSSCGNKYQTILHEIYGNSKWIEQRKKRQRDR